MTIYPRNYFAPYSPCETQATINHVVENKDSYTIHWFNANWNLSRKGYIFITTKYINNPILKALIKVKRYLGYKK